MENLSEKEWTELLKSKRKHIFASFQSIYNVDLIRGKVS